MKDYYKTLGVERSATLAEIKTAFRKLAMKSHPDRNPGDKTAEQRFKDVNEAYENLEVSDKRARHDHELTRGSTRRFTLNKKPRDPV